MSRYICLSHTVTLEIVDLPRSGWRYLPPRRWEVALTLAGIVLAAVAWGVFNV